MVALRIMAGLIRVELDCGIGRRAATRRPMPMGGKEND